jgi:regulatory protein
MARKTPPTCIDAAFNMLSRRDYAVKEMAGKLKDKKYSGKEIAEVIDRLKELNYLNDEKFALNKARSRAEFSRWGQKRIEMELKTKGVAEDLIRKAIQCVETGEGAFMADPHNWKEEARDLLSKKFGHKPLQYEDPDADLSDWEEKMTQRKEYEKEKNKRLNFLIRRGFTMDQAIYALENASEK